MPRCSLMRAVAAPCVLLVTATAPVPRHRAPAADFHLERLADGVYAVVRNEPPSLYFQSNSTFVVGDSGVLVVDTQFSTSATLEVLAAVRRITSKPVRYVVNTHGHDDHITGNQVYRDSFPGVAFIAHESTRETMVREGATKRKELLAVLPGTIGFFRRALQSGNGPYGSPLTAEERAGFASDSTIAARFLTEAPRLELVPATRVVNDRLTLDLGRRTVDVLHLGRGHSDGDLLVHLPDERIVATGDLVVAPVPLVGSTSHPAEFAAALERLLALRPATLIPGHGPVLRDTAHVALVRRLLVSIRDQVDASVERGDTLAQTRRRVNVDEFRAAIVGASTLRRFVFANYVTGPAVAAAFADASAARAQRDRAAWVRANAVPIADGSSDANLAAIGAALDGVDVVLLGESSHGDGGGHLARLRLVRYLHEQLGFDVIAWEAGVREAVAFDSLLATPAPLGAIAPLALYPWWAESAELRPVLEYLRAMRRTTRPLTFAGFDIQRSGPLDSLVSYLARSFDRSNDSRLFPPMLRDSLSRGFSRMASLSDTARDSVEQALEAALYAAAPELERRFASARPALTGALGAQEADVLARVLANLSANAERSRVAREPDQTRRLAASVASYNLRERHNAENILWLLRQRYPGRKLIVWLHNVHAINAQLAPRFDAIAATGSENARDATARVVKDSLGNRSYAVAMLSFDGAWAFPGEARTELPPAAPGSLASQFHEAGFPRAFLDVRSRAGRPVPGWLAEPMPGTVNTQTPARYPVIWPRVADGVLFVDRMTPSTKAGVER